MSKIVTLLEKHTKLRTTGINLIASENFLSSDVRKALASDLAGRYHSDWYGGSKFAAEIIKETEDMARKAFKVKHAIVSSLSGNMCDLAVMFAFTKPGDKIAMLPFNAGGYPLGVEKFYRKRLFLPADSNRLELDVKAARQLVVDEKVPLTILGPSFIPFPQPMRELSEGIKESSVFVYDGSHVLGLIACGTFQDPVGEGADILIGSTHKSLYGPQGGIVLTNSPSKAEKMRKMLDFTIEEGIALVDNPHVNRIAALGIALEEMTNDPDYGYRVVRNAKALAKALDELGVPVKFKERGFTESHQILLDLKDEEAESLCQRLEAIGVYVDVACRIGVAEVTHTGMETTDMDFIAGVISDVYKGDIQSDLASKVIEFKKNFAI